MKPTKLCCPSISVLATPLYNSSNKPADPGLRRGRIATYTEFHEQKKVLEQGKGDESANLPSTPCDVVVAISRGHGITIPLSQEHRLLALVACQQVAQQLQA